MYPQRFTKCTENYLWIAQINVEALKRVKDDVLGKIFSDADVLTIQETLVPESDNRSLTIYDFYLVDCVGHNKHKLPKYVNH